MQVKSVAHLSPAPVANKHGFDGSCAPGSMAGWSGQVGFSVGVFQWLPKSGGKGLKKGSVKVRIKGYMHDADKVYEKAREVCAKLDAGWVPERKSISV